MDHLHEHTHSHALVHINKAFILGIAFNLIFVLIEAVIGLFIHSLSLLSDAGHNLADVGALGLSLLAFKLGKFKPNYEFTYGYRKTSILVALFNAVVLLASVGVIIFEAAHKLFHPEPLPGSTIAMVAGIGILINGFTAILFFRDKDKDLNIKSAYLHLMSDAIVSLSLVIGGIVISYTGLFWIDSGLSLIIAGIIFLTTWDLLKKSLRLSMDAVPENVNVQEIRSEALRVKGVKDLHHIHVWAMSTTENALTAHLVLAPDASAQQELTIKNRVKHVLRHKNIHHITIETEREDQPCDKTDEV